jgi:molybdenum-dependent DNA-binding transcriptional regulator ModE
MTLKELHEKEMIRALQHFKTIEEAAKALGISDRKIYLFKKKNKL